MLCTLAAVFACAVAFPAEPPRVGTPIAAPAGIVQVAPPESEVSRANIEATIRALPVKRAGYPDAEQREGLLKAQNDLIARLKALGYEPQLSDVVFAQRPKPGGEPAEPLPWKNIAVDIPGREAPTEFYVFGAHFDAVPAGPGADDNASGVAALLEMARILKDRPMKRSVRMIFFNLEEAGLIGSRQYCERIQPEVAAGAIKILGMASFDGLGYYSDKHDSQRWPELNLPNLKLPSIGNFIAVGGLAGGRGFSQPFIAAMRAADAGLPVLEGDILPLPVPDFMRSDHAPFVLLGVPGIIITDTANFRSPHYHQETDTIETLDLDRLTKVTRQLVGAAWRIAGPVGAGHDDPAPAPGAPGVAPTPPAPADPQPRPASPDVDPIAPKPQPPGRTPETPRGLPPTRP
jgi:hypothetical protein